MPKITNTLLSLPENDDSMDCPECTNGIEDDGYVCYYCNGAGVVSEREYNEQIRTELDDFNANN